MAALKYWIWLSTRDKVGPSTAQKLIEYFGSPEKVYFAREDDFRKIDWLKKSELQGLKDKSIKKSVDTVDFCRRHKVKIITLNDSDYPDRLRNIYAPPTVLYVLGRMPDVDDEPAVAIVGTRKCSAYGSSSAEKIAREYASCGGLVVTGMAVGIDSAAARGAIKGGGSVIAVLGSGIDVLYPYENRGLFKEVYKHGAIISEFPPGTPPMGKNFPIRNRIISGLSVGVLVVEAPEKSGALITAARAAEQGRDVFAVPGDINKSGFMGSNSLLRDGAAIVTSGYQLAEEYIALYPDKLNIRQSESENNIETDTFEKEKKPENAENVSLNSPKPTKLAIDNTKSIEYIDLYKTPDLLDDDEKAVVGVMSSDTAMHIDEIISRSGLPASKALSALTMLEIKGYVAQYPGKNFALDVLLKV